MTARSAQGHFLYGILGTTCIIKAVGNINYRIGGSFDRFISKLFADNAIEDFLIDLTEAEYIDSTNLGLLARIQVFSVERLSRRPTVISTNPAINGILRNLGFDRLFTIVDTATIQAGNLHELPAAGQDEAEMRKTLLSAHRYLASTSKENAIAFREVVELLERDARGRGSSRTP
ncbi:MAG: STAS domain-containing protein [Chitinivibrionales bacterium]|nr:STAS domain-containing protein [Chitinivibrionales bacterium]MBD3394394.1 STAS domain-containing protein [Chitinivibrionales bacterium]